MDKKPFVTKEQLESITKEYPTPFHLYDEKGNSGKCKALEEGLCLESRISGIFCREGYAESLSFADFEGGGLRS